MHVLYMLVELPVTFLMSGLALSFCGPKLIKSAKLPPFHILFSLKLKYASPQRNLNLGFSVLCSPLIIFALCKLWKGVVVKYIF
jgi:hypothetical protein